MIMPAPADAPANHQLTILLCTYNGARFLPAQLQSIADQTFVDFEVIASDDGSTDGTLRILQHAAATTLAGRLRIVEGPRRGVNANFLSITNPAASPSPFLSYADQDDIWDKDKLQRAMDWFSTIDPSRPALYGTRTRLINEAGAPIGHSPLFRRPAGFSNALVQNMFGGNTMVFNAAAWRVLKNVAPTDVVSHDWWTYLAVTATGGLVRYEAEPSLSYRQHAANLVGANISWKARLVRTRMLMEGRFVRWNTTNAKALTPLKEEMDPQAVRTFERFQRARRTNFPTNLFWLLRSGVYRQTWLSDMGLWLATVTRRI